MRYIRSGRHPWRHHLDKKKWRRRRRICCGLLLSCLMVQICFLYLEGAFEKGILSMRMIRQEEEYELEVSTRDFWQKNGSEDVFGVRVRPDTLEIQFYHRQEQAVRDSGE